MGKRTIYISNDPITKDGTMERVMIRIAEEMEAQILIEDFKSTPSDSFNDPLVILCSGVNLEDRSVLDSIARRYYNNQHIVLYEPTNREINTVYRYIEGRDYFSTETIAAGYTLFGLKQGEDGISYVLENHEKKPEQVSESLVNFLENKQEALNRHFQKGLMDAARETLNEESSETVNLAQTARRYVITKQFELSGKQFSISYYMVSCHVYAGDSLSGGEDWFFIQQYGILNGAGGYKKYWAGSRVEVNEDSWYVGQGEVALNYVDFYQMTNNIICSSDSDMDAGKDICLLYVEPQAINQTTTYTISESQSISGSIGFEGGKEGEDSALKGNGSVSVGASFDTTYTFEVADCSCEGTSLGNASASAGWKYSFKRATQNRSAGKWQYLHDPAKLSTSVFSPLNTWIWKFPTQKRDTYKQFSSKFEVGIMNTISRYSGSQSPKNIRGNSSGSTSFSITLHMPPLLGVDQRSLLFSNERSTKTLKVASQGTWELKVKDQRDTWVSISETSGSGAGTEVYITANELKGENGRSAILELKRKKDENTVEELIEIKVFQSPGSTT